jgi:hypothetical protein
MRSEYRRIDIGMLKSVDNIAIYALPPCYLHPSAVLSELFRPAIYAFQHP